MESIIGFAVMLLAVGVAIAGATSVAVGREIVNTPTGSNQWT